MSATMSILLNVDIQWKIVVQWLLIFGMPIWVSVWDVSIAPRNPSQVIHGDHLKSIHPEITGDDCYG